jgi:DNA-binding PadR family transcriptional regulator
VPPNGLRRPNDPPLLILVSLAAGPKHGHALAKDIEDFAGVRLGPGALYGAITRLVERGLIEPLGSDDRRRPYRITPPGSAAQLRQHATSASTRLRPARGFGRHAASAGIGACTGIILTCRASRSWEAHRGRVPGQLRAG